MQTLLHQHRLRALYCHLFLHNHSGSHVYVLRFQRENHPHCIRENFNKTKYIGFSTYILLLSSIAHYPVAFVVIENLYVALVSCLTTLATSFGLLVCVPTQNPHSPFPSPAKHDGIRQVEGVEFLLWKREQELSPSQSMPEYLNPL